MRIIAGKYRGRRLRAPVGRGVRPTSDRLRESIFNIIGPAIQDAEIIDIFAGTGAMGIEALSRGAARVLFIDNNRRALETIRTNVDPLRIPEQWALRRWDAVRNLNCLTQTAMRFRYAFIDPPYNQGFANRTLNNLVDSGAMAPGGLIVVEHHHLETIEEPNHRIVPWDQRRYGKTLVTFLRIMI
jgi:16S rRNA (guanine(966)-N(2))-methyltransferase RsmD